MNKVLVIIGSIVVCLIGVFFFFAGLFTGSEINSTNTVDIVDKIKNKIENTIGDMPQTQKLEQIEDNDGPNIPNDNEIIDSKQNSGLILEKPETSITVDMLLNEVVADHTTVDNCLLDSVKTENRQPVTNNAEKETLVFVGYFSSEVAQKISNLLMAKGYPAHTQMPRETNLSAFVFCGPFAKKENANNLLKWLKMHEFSNAKIIDQKNLQQEILTPDAISKASKNLPENQNLKPASDKTNEDSEAKTEEAIDKEAEDYADKNEQKPSNKKSKKKADKNTKKDLDNYEDYEDELYDEDYTDKSEQKPSNKKSKEKADKNTKKDLDDDENYEDELDDEDYTDESEQKPSDKKGKKKTNKNTKKDLDDYEDYEDELDDEDYADKN